MDLKSRPKQRDKIIKQTTSDTLVLVNLENGECYGLNEVGGRLWELCDGTRSVSDVIAILSQEYEAADGAIATDVVEMLEELTSENLVVVES
jgi:pyrroloquinoline quinone biosynthesis protein D